MRVLSIWRYPVKSMGGTTVPDAHLHDQGIDGDRRWATRDLVSGEIRGAKKLHALLQCTARFLKGPDGPVEIRLPDGTSVRTTEADLDERLSAVVGRAVRLEALHPSTDLDHYRRGSPDTDDMMAELRAVFGRDDDEPLPDLAQFPPVIFEYTSPPGTYVDVHPLMIMTTSALRSLEQALPASNTDVRRFRPSFVVDTGTAPGHPELAWAAGRRFRVGEAEIEVVGPCPRCVMPTLAVDEHVPADRAILRHIVRDLDQNLGVYARVTRPGRIAVGDPFEPVL